MTHARAPQAPAGDAGYSVRVIDSADALEAIGPAWRALAARLAQPNVFATPEWCAAALAHGLAGGVLHVLVVERGGTAVAVAPFVRRDLVRFGVRIRKLEFVSNDLTDYAELLWDSRDTGALQALASSLAWTARDWDLIDMRNIAAGAPWVGAFRHSLEQVALRSRAHPWDACSYLPISSTWEEHLGEHSRSTRHRYQKQARRIERLRDTGLVLRVTDAPHLEPDLVARIAAVDRVRGGTAPPGPVTRHPAFFDQVIRELGPAGWLLLAVAERNGQMLAYALCFRCGARIWGYAKAYDREHAQLSLGAMLMPAVFDYGRAHGCDEFDFLRGAEAYKRDVTEAVRITERVEAWSATPRSRLAAVLSALQRRLSKRTAPIG